MSDKIPTNGIEQKLGIVIGQMTGLAGDIKRLNGDLKQHIRDHRSGWLWVLPTLISLATLTVLVFTHGK